MPSFHAAVLKMDQFLLSSFLCFFLFSVMLFAFPTEERPHLEVFPPGTIVNYTFYRNEELWTILQTDYAVFEAASVSNMSNNLIYSLVPEYIRRLLTDEQILEIMTSRMSDLSAQMKILGTLNECYIRSSLCRNPSAAYDITTSISPNSMWLRNVGFQSQIGEVFKRNDFKKVTPDFARGATENDLQKLFDKNLLTTHLMRLIDSLATRRHKDFGLCRYILKLLHETQKRDPQFRLMPVDIEPWIFCISPYEAESMTGKWNEIVVKNLNSLLPMSQRQAVTSLSYAARWAIEGDTFHLEVSKLANVGDKIKFTGIADFIHLSKDLLTILNNFEFDPDSNPLQLQVLENHFLTNSVNNHRSHYQLGQLLPALSEENLEKFDLNSQLEYVLQDGTYQAKYLSRQMLRFLSNTLMKQRKNQEPMEGFALKLCDLITGLPLKDLTSFSARFYMNLLETCPKAISIMPSTQRIFVAFKLLTQRPFLTLPQELIEDLEVKDLKDYLIEVGYHNDISVFAKGDLAYEVYPYKLSYHQISPELATYLGPAVKGLNFKHLESLHYLDKIDVLRIFGARKVHFSRTEAKRSAGIIREVYQKLRFTNNFNVNLLPKQDLYFLPAEIFLEFEYLELTGIDKLGCQNIFNRLEPEYVLQLPKSRARMLVNIYFQNCKEDRNPRKQDIIGQKDVDTLKHLICYSPENVIESLSYQILTDALIYFSQCSIDDSLAEILSRKLHFVFIIPKKVADLGANFCSVFKFDAESVDRLKSQKQYFLSSFLYVLETIKSRPMLDENMKNCTRILTALVKRDIQNHPQLSSMKLLCDRQPDQFLTCQTIRSLGWGNLFLDYREYRDHSSKCELERCAQFITENLKFFKPESLKEIASVLLPNSRGKNRLSTDKILSAAKLLPFTKHNLENIFPIEPNGEASSRLFEILEELGKVRDLNSSHSFDFFLGKNLPKGLGLLEQWKVSLLGELFCRAPKSKIVETYFLDSQEYHRSLHLIGRLRTCSPGFFKYFANESLRMYDLQTSWSPYLVKKLGILIPHLPPEVIDSFEAHQLQLMEPEVVNKFPVVSVKRNIQKLTLEQLAGLDAQVLKQLSPEDMEFIADSLEGAEKGKDNLQSTTQSVASEDGKTADPSSNLDYISRESVRVIYIYSSSHSLVCVTTISFGLLLFAISKHFI